MTTCCPNEWRRTALIAGLLLFTAAVVGPNASAQDGAENPMATLKDEVERVLDDANLPFTDQQDDAIGLMMEDRRQASEELFGDLFDFTAGPTQGQEADRLSSAIDWMRNEFLTNLRGFLTPEQLDVWTRFESENGVGLASAEGPTVGGAPPPRESQTQFVRINNNAFTAEDSSFRFGRNNRRGGGGGNRASTEVIQRGGVGAFHGNVESLFKDESLNAGRRFASNKPPYQERQVSVNVSGPVLPGLLTTDFSFSRNESKNVDTINAQLPDGVFALGITKPATNRAFSTVNTLQLTNEHSLTFDAGYESSSSENQGIGGFTLPERAYTSGSNSWNFGVKQFSSLSPTDIFEAQFSVTGNHNETTPVSEGLKINVPDAFSSGGAQNTAHDDGRTYAFGSLYTRLGEGSTIKTGFDGTYQTGESFSQNNFTGTFSFPTLDAYLAGTPNFFRVNVGEPLVETSQFEMAVYFQDDIKLTPSFTLMTGVRYQDQTNISDHNNIDPRVGIAYALGRATVIRGGVGMFHDRYAFGTVENQRRLDGTRQYEIVIDKPTYPDPFQGGTIRDTLRSVRVTDPDLATPYSTVAMVSYERTFLTNLFISVQYDINRSVHRYRNRNLNAPRDITSPTPASCKPGQSADTCVRPFPDQGNILNVESTGNEFSRFLRVNYRQRFSVFTMTASYTHQTTWSDTPQNLVSNPINVGWTPEGLSSDQFNLRADWNPAAFPRHNFNATVNAQMPLGIFLTGVMSGNTGQAYTIITGRDDNQDTAVNDRPPGLPRNSEDGPNQLTFDFNISKAFFLGEPVGNPARSRMNVNLFANMTNAFNRPNYARPSGIMTSPNFGKSTSAGNPREIEAGLRFQF